jgi:hypothetical protein
MRKAAEGALLGEHHAHRVQLPRQWVEDQAELLECYGAQEGLATLFSRSTGVDCSPWGRVMRRSSGAGPPGSRPRKLSILL